MQRSFVRPIKEYLLYQSRPAFEGKSGPALLLEFRRKWEELLLLIDWYRRVFLHVESRLMKSSEASESRTKSLTEMAAAEFRDVSAIGGQVLLCCPQPTLIRWIMWAPKNIMVLAIT